MRVYVVIIIDNTTGSEKIDSVYESNLDAEARAEELDNDTDADFIIMTESFEVL